MVRLALVGALLLGSCTNELVARTELVLVADTDLDPSTIHGIGFRVTHRNGKPEDRSGNVADLPLTLTVEHEGGELGPVFLSAYVVATGKDHEEHTFERQQEVWFVAGKTLKVPLFLSKDCLEGSECKGATPVCVGKDQCVPTRMDNLEPWTGGTSHVGGDDQYDASMNPISEADAGMSGRDAGAHADAGQSQGDAGPSDPTLCPDGTHAGQNDKRCGDCNTDCTEMDDSDGAGEKHLHGVCGADLKCHKACVEGFVSCGPPPNLNGNGCESVVDDTHTCETSGCRCSDG